MNTFPAWKPRIALALGATLLALAPARAALPQDVKDVLEKSIEASGGRETVSAITSSRLVGEFNIAAMGMKGRSEIVQAYPDKVYSLQELPGMGKIVQAYDGEVGWAEDPMQGFRYLSEGEVTSLKQNDSFAAMLHYEDQFSAGEMLPEADVNGESAAVVKLVGKESQDEQTRYYSKESGLLLRIDTIADMGPMGKLPASMVVKSYNEQDGVKYPSEMEMTNAGFVVTISFESLEINPEIDDSLFAAPQ